MRYRLVFCGIVYAGLVFTGHTAAAGDVENSAIATAYLRQQGINGAEASMIGDQMAISVPDLARISGTDIFSPDIKKLLRFGNVRFADVADRRGRHIYYIVKEDRITSERP